MFPMMGGFGVGLGGAGGGTEPVFHALFIDGSTKEMRGVLKGVGDLTEGCVSTRYQPDWENLWRSWGSGEPAWRGGRKVENLCLDSNPIIESGAWDFPAPTNGSVVENGDGSITCTSTGDNARAYFFQSIVLIDGATYTFSVDVLSADSGWTSDSISVTGSNPGGTIIDGTGRQFHTFTALASGAHLFRMGIGARTGESGQTSGSMTLALPQIENVSGQADQTPSEYIPTTTAAAYKVFGTEKDGTPLADLPRLYGGPALTNDQIRSTDLADAEWTASNMTVAKDAVGMRGEANGASTLTATAANATVLANALTEASADQTTRWSIKRKTGTGVIEITVDGGSTWEDVTTEVDSTVGFNEAIESLAALANPQIGIRAVTDTDAVIVGNAGMHVGKTEVQVRDSTPTFTAGTPVSVNATDDSFDDANHTASQGGYYVEWTPQYATAEVSGDIEILSLNNSAGLLYYDATNSLLKSTDGTNTVSVALTIVAGTTYKVWVAYGGTSLQVGFDSTTGTAGTFDGAFATGTKIEVITPSGNVTLLRNLRHYDLPFASVVPKLQALSA